MVTSAVIDQRTAPVPRATCGGPPYNAFGVNPDVQLHRFIVAAQTQTIAAGMQIMGEGEPATHVYQLARGTARLFKLFPDGRRQVVGFWPT